MNLPVTNSIDLYAYICNEASQMVNTNKITWTCSNPLWTIQPDSNGEKATINFSASGTGTVSVNGNFKHQYKDETKSYNNSAKIAIGTELPEHIFATPILPKSPEPCVTQQFIDIRWGHSYNNKYIHSLSDPEERKDFYARMFAFVTLQGLVNRTQPRLYQVDSWYQMYAFEYDDYMLSFYTNTYNMVFVEHTNLYALIEEFAKPPEVERVVIYPDSLFADHDKGDLINYMTVLCAVSNCIALSTEDYHILTNEYDFSLPVIEVLDEATCAQRALTNSIAIYTYMIENFWPQCSRRAIAHIHPLLFQVSRDYFVAHKIFPFFYREDFPEMYSEFDDLLDEMPLNSAILGDVGRQTAMNKDYCRMKEIKENSEGTTNILDFAIDGEDTSKYQAAAGQNMRRENPLYPAVEPLLAPGETIVGITWDFMEPIPYHDIVDGNGIYEHGMWEHTSKRGKTMQYMLGLANASFHSGFDGNDISFNQNINTNIPYEANKVYMCSFISDGDNMDYSRSIFYNRWLRDGVATNHYVSLGFNLLMYELAPDIMDYFYKNKDSKISIDAETGVGSMESLVYGKEISFGNWSTAEKRDFALKSYLALTSEYLEKLDIQVARPNFEANLAEFYLYEEMLSNTVNAIGPGYGPVYGEYEDFQIAQTRYEITNSVLLLPDDWAHKIQPDRGEHENLVLWVDIDGNFPQFHSCWFQYCHGWYEDWLAEQYSEDDNQKLRLVPPTVFQNFFRKSKGVE